MLEGKLLIPHRYLPEGYGISLPAYLDDPSPVGLISWLQRVGLYRYAAKRPLGNAGRFALFFN